MIYHNMENGDTIEVTIHNNEKLFVGCNFSNGANNDWIIFQTIDAYIFKYVI